MTAQQKRKIKISDYLRAGKKNARTARELAQVFNCDMRDISARIEKERRQGAPICASCDSRRPGYYLAETSEELQEYCRTLHNRAGQIYLTRRELLKAAKKLPAREKQEA